VHLNVLWYRINHFSQMRLFCSFHASLIQRWDDRRVEVAMNPFIRQSQNYLVIILHDHVLWLRQSPAFILSRTSRFFPHFVSDRDSCEYPPADREVFEMILAQMFAVDEPKKNCFFQLQILTTV
jgi:hypothetical protein